MKGNETIREAVFTSLRAMLEVEEAKNHFPARRRILATMEWLKQFGELPVEGVLSETLERLRASHIPELDESEAVSESNESDSDGSTSTNSEEEEVVHPKTPPERPEGETWQIT